MAQSAPESRLAHELLDGLTGIEIGGSAHNPFGIPGCINVDYTASMDTVFKRREVEICGAALPVDVVAAGDALPFADASLDYVLTSHVLEHFFDPIKTFKEWLRVLKPAGLIYAIVPHKERTHDVARPRTTLLELIERHTGVILPPALDDHRHWSVWITADVLELGSQLGLELVAYQDVDDKVGNGFTVVFRKPVGYDAAQLDLHAMLPPKVELPYRDSVPCATQDKLLAAWERTDGWTRTADGVLVNDKTAAVTVLRSVWRRDVEIEATLAVADVPGDGNIGLMARYNGDGDCNFYLARLAGRGTAERTYHVEIVRDLAGHRCLLASRQVPQGAGRMRFALWGERLEIVWNGQPVAVATDDALGAGRIGLRARAPLPGCVRVTDVVCRPGPTWWRQLARRAKRRCTAWLRPAA